MVIIICNFPLQWPDLYDHGFTLCNVTLLESAVLLVGTEAYIIRMSHTKHLQRLELW